MNELWDVVIFNIESGKVYKIAGAAMKRSTGFYNAEKRLDTVLPRLNERHDAAIVETGKYKVGDVMESHT